MSYIEYIDMFKAAQEKGCPYRAFVIDIVNSRQQSQYIVDTVNHHRFVDYIYSLLENEEKLLGKEILLKDGNNQHIGLFERKGINGNLYNPMVLGDMAAYFVYNGSITADRFMEIAITAMKEYNITYPFHFATGVYETNDYASGGSKMYKGYMPQILETVSKKSGIVLSKDTIITPSIDLEM